MNQLLLTAEMAVAEGRYKVEGPRKFHIDRVLKKKVGDRIRAGLIGGLCGAGTIIDATVDSLLIGDLTLTEPPPPASKVKLILALPRPKVAGRLLESITELGVKNVVLIHSAKVEKSYWEAHQLRPDQIRKHLLHGLEISRDTILPVVKLAPRFRPFVEDELPAWMGNSKGIIADPTGAPYSPEATHSITLAIGPEGGWTPYEIELFMKMNFSVARFGDRILSCETSVPGIIGQLSTND